jgi:hypothetical protein
MDDDKCGAIGGMSGRATEVLGENLSPSSLCPPQIPYDLILHGIQEVEMQVIINHEFGMTWRDEVVTNEKAFS